MTTEQMDAIDDANEGGPKALREALAKQKAENEALAKSLKDLRDKDRAREIKDRGLSPKVAKFIPEDANLEKWLEENAEVFGIKPGEAAQTQETQQAEGDANTRPLEVAQTPHPLQNQFANLEQTQASAQAPRTVLDTSRVQAALEEGGLEGFENFLLSQRAPGA
jgi:Asp-tRNA(Asn)/Glu-tRNA(Gln) amidotransferase B subunit